MNPTPTPTSPAPGNESPAPARAVAASASGSGAVPEFGVNEVRLGPGQWLVALALFGLVLALTPRVWRRVERFDTGPDYRIPYSLSRDYWLYARRLESLGDPAAIRVVGDSVVWGEYVRPDGTWTHYLDREAGLTNRFVNAGVNGMFPLALEGLVGNYGGSLAGRKVLLHCNLLWMTSPKADLSTPKEESFNHARLVPQFAPRIPCYRAGTEERMAAVVERNVGFLQWVGHLENAYFAQKSVPQWTLADDGADPPRYPNLYRNPLARITLRVPSPYGDDPDRGPASPRHRPWNRNGARAVEFEWVPATASLQWPAFQRTVRGLRSVGADVFVVVGPFNESMLGEGSRKAYGSLRETVVGWLAGQGVPHLAPEPLPSELYADASHPLTEGYALLAKRMLADGAFHDWAGVR